MREGCEVFHLSSVFYGVIYDDFGEEGVLKDLKSITLPSSVQLVEAEEYPWIELDYLKKLKSVDGKTVYGRWSNIEKI